MSNRGLALSVIIVLGYSCAGDDRPPSAESTGGSTSVDLTATTTAVSTDPADTGTTRQPSSAVTTPTSAPSISGRVREPYVTFALPAGWQRGPAAVATQFATGADCVAATVVDFEPPTDPAADVGAGFTLRSTVQVCAQPTDDDTLIGFLTATYGDPTSFEPVEIGGVAGYRSTTGLQTVTFVQTDSYRVQVLTDVTAEGTLEPERLSQVGDIVASMRFE